MAANFGSAVFGRAFWGIDRNNDWSPQSYKILTRHKLGETNSRIRLEVYFYNLTIQPQIPACRYLKPLWGTSAPRAAMFFGTRYMECPLGLGLWLDGSRVRLHPGVNKYRWGMDKNGCICLYIPLRISSRTDHLSCLFLLLQWWVSLWRSPALLLSISISFFLWGHHEVTEFEVILQSNLKLKRKILVEEVWTNLVWIHSYIYTVYKIFHCLRCCHLIFTKGGKLTRGTCR